MGPELPVKPQFGASLRICDLVCKHCGILEQQQHEVPSSSSALNIQDSVEMFPSYSSRPKLTVYRQPNYLQTAVIADNYSSSLVGSQPGTLSSSVSDACRIESTKTVFVTLGWASKLSTESVSAGASVGTTTIIVSPVQSQVKTDLSVDAATTDSVPAYEPTMGFSSHSEAGHPTSEISSLEYSTISRTVLSTRTVTLTVAPAGKGSTSSASSVASDVKGTGVSTAVTESPSNVATRITHTVGGPDGRSAVVESIIIITEPAGASTPAVLGTANSDNSASVTAPGIPVPSYVSITSGLPVHTSFTAIGPDGSSTIIDTTWIIPSPPTSLMSGLNPLPSEVLSSQRIVSGLPSNAASEATSESPITSVMGIPTCTTVTVVGPDMRLTVTELTIIAPTGAPTATTFTLAPPSFVAPASMTNLVSQPPITSNSIETTITWKVIGADGTVSPIIQTITAPSGSIISDIPASLPAAVTANFPQPAVTGSSGNVPLLTPYGTARATGENPSSVSSVVSGIGSMPTFVPAPPGSEASHAITEEPPAYTLATALPNSSHTTTTIGSQDTVRSSPLQYGTSSPDSDWISSILYGSFPAPTPPVTPMPGTPEAAPVPTPVPGTPEADPVPAPAPENPEPAPVPTPVPGTSEPAPLPTPAPVTPETTPQPLPAPATPEAVTTLVTSTWTNTITEQTTTYVIKFPLTTMATVTVPRVPAFRKRLLRRQGSVGTSLPFSNSSTTTPSPLTENTSLISSLSSQLVTPITTPVPTSTIPASTTPSSSINTSTIQPQDPSPTICASGGSRVGNSTVNFDDVLPGPLLNPAGDLWFSEGFLVAPPSSPPSDAYLASSGNQLLQFMPPALVPDAPFDGAGDTAEISVGPNEISSCFRFNFYGASLGCAAEGVEQWCEFEFSAYTYNETLGSETSLDWSETKRIPACPNFPQGPCALFPVQLDGYNNLTSILVTVRVGLELRAWWGDDFHVGWTDNTCEAVSCRSSVISRRAKREAFSRSSRRGVWQWTPNGAKKLDDDYVWSSFE
ncbi:hypothetical protein BBO_03651 [Beauveria brongniartii RCEF 3172]|uniref:DUF7371 domain-containing protein n=1 Tax=Beauveria brongniartii RCEF 3172 TaxID=1081107 RepID=A0A162LWL1_9HYPO|nr:hypothetical protein BBO_03651 [Beauveria brongniartii RCEF 3172]